MVTTNMDYEQEEYYDEDGVYANDSAYDGGSNGAWGSVSYGDDADGNWTANLTTDEYLEIMLGPKQVYEIN